VADHQNNRNGGPWVPPRAAWMRLPLVLSASGGGFCPKR
jgi:hypothetical protein